MSVLRRIHIIGGPGSGKSYAALQLSRLLGIPAYDLDELFWDRAAPSYGVRAPAAERNARLAAIAQEEIWIIEGVYYGWLGPSFERADRIFVLRPHVLLRDWRIVKRFVLRNRGLFVRGGGGVRVFPCHTLEKIGGAATDDDFVLKLTKPLQGLP